MLTSLVSVNPIYASFDADEDVVLRAIGSIADAGGKRGKLDQIPVEMSTSSGVTVKGRIQLIDNQVNGQSGTIRVRASFDNEDGRLIPGQFARVRMGQPKQQTLVMVDERAIGTDQDKKFVMVVGADNRALYRPITLGGNVEGLRIVTSGLKLGRPRHGQWPAAGASRCARQNAKWPRWACVVRSTPPPTITNTSRSAKRVAQGHYP